MPVSTMSNQRQAMEKASKTSGKKRIAIRKIWSLVVNPNLSPIKKFNYKRKR
jgi:hypothetical protein